MGKVFTPEALTDHIIPEPGAHEKAGRFILNRLFEPEEHWTNEKLMIFEIDGSDIPSGLVYGSTALGRTCLRSDVDVLVNFHASRADSALPIIRAVFQEAEDTYCVPVESNVLPVGALYNPLEHSIDPLFAEHLITIQNHNEPRWSYNWPVDGLALNRLAEEQVRSIAVRYASGKSRQFVRAIIDYRGTPDLQVMQRALELPGAIGRKVIAATRKESDDVPDLSDKYSMSEITLQKLDQFALSWHRLAVNYQRKLHKLDKTYDQLLQSTIDGGTSVDEYGVWLQDNYLSACRMAQEVSYVWSEIISHRMDIPLDQKLIAVNMPSEMLDQDIY